MFGLSPYPDAAVGGAILALTTLIWVIALIRILGLKTLSKMTAFDFVVTLATGSLLATAATAAEWPGFWRALSAMATLLAAQYLLARARRTGAIRRLLENEPLMLVHRGRFIESALTESRVTRDDVIAKLRAASVYDIGDVGAVVLEATGDISVIAGEDKTVSTLDGVRNKPNGDAA